MSTTSAQEPAPPAEQGGEGEDLGLRVCGLAAVTGILAGVLGSAFRAGLSHTSDLHLQTVSRLAPLGAAGWAGIAAIAVVFGVFARWLVEAFAPESSGSGIPSVEGRLGDDVPLRWRRVIPVKFVGGIASLGAGMSLGREGPTVHLGASVAEGLAERLRVTAAERRALVAAGAGAGIATAFNAPLAGFLFVLEELRQPASPTAAAAALIAAATSTAVMNVLLGSEPLLLTPSPASPAVAALGLFAGLGAVCGLVGVLFNRALVAALDGFDSLDAISHWWRGVIAGLVTTLVAAIAPAALYGGEPSVHAILRGVIHPGNPAAVLAILAIVKLILTVVCYGSGVVGGIFAPLLLIGAATGGALGSLLDGVLAEHLSLTGVLGMDVGNSMLTLSFCGALGVLTASVRAPATGLALLLEMTRLDGLVLPAMVTGIAAHLAAGALGDRPIYEALATRAQRATRAVEESVEGGSAAAAGDVPP